MQITNLTIVMYFTFLAQLLAHKAIFLLILTHNYFRLQPAYEAAGRWCCQSCLFVCSQGGNLVWPLPMIHWTSPYWAPPPVHVPLQRDLPLYMSPLLVTFPDQNWRPIQTCSHDESSPCPGCWHLAACVASTVGEWAVFILLECFLVNSSFIRGSNDKDK